MLLLLLHTEMLPCWYHQWHLLWLLVMQVTGQTAVQAGWQRPAFPAAAWPPHNHLGALHLVPMSSALQLVAPWAVHTPHPPLLAAAVAAVLQPCCCCSCVHSTTLYSCRVAPLFLPLLLHPLQLQTLSQTPHARCCCGLQASAPMSLACWVAPVCPPGPGPCRSAPHPHATSPGLACGADGAGGGAAAGAEHPGCHGS